jgi:uncharacterized protein with ATP-grasp and redox domains
VNITPECVACIFNQALRVTKVLDLDAAKSKEILDLAASHVPSFSLQSTPPQNATPLYEAIAKHLGTDDIYHDIKLRSIKKAKELQPKCHMLLEESLDKFLTATKIAVVGNVIDLASEVMYDLDEEVDKVMDTAFAIDDTKALYAKLSTSTKVVYLADNAGENIFDLLFIQYIKSEFPKLDISYFVRGKPIINDLCMADMKDDPLHKFTQVVDSGVSTPGIVYHDMNILAQKLFDSADCIISKGMGNYECLSTNRTHPLFFLLKIKCQVVSTSLNRPLGAIICKRA